MNSLLAMRQANPAIIKGGYFLIDYFKLLYSTSLFFGCAVHLTLLKLNGNP